ncbi:hypothetical protein ATHL_03472 [Anaerolinea thermolimosa]|uniref:Uncharacterized protein n=1 Tax=Anaerolinea thermolimosa TaxID=229919 RepID=A0A7U9PTA5_9CHLR|nr:hypothetical protein [Anaerolinea thermolimosa]GAP08567.1 hypothetical protein ATHL_03472 [Anaerolinea thermolimosa]
MFDKAAKAVQWTIGIIFLIFWMFVVILAFPYIAMPALVVGLVISGLIAGEFTLDDLKPKEVKKKEEEENWMSDWDEPQDWSF